MARGHPDLPKKIMPLILSKRQVFDSLKAIDNSQQATTRILGMETEFRERIDNHISALPQRDAEFKKFNTSPFVLMFYSRQQSFNHVAEIEKAIIPAKVFSSMETSAGRMVESVTLPVYGWETVESTMHSPESVLDGRKETDDDIFLAATLKSGPRCLNDEMAKDIGLDVIVNSPAWAQQHDSRRVEFSYGVLYGTKKQSNKKDWHILRNMGETLPDGAVVESSWKEAWGIEYQTNDLDIAADVRVGIDWWDYLGGKDTWIEVCVSLIRACIVPSQVTPENPQYAISDLGDILNLDPIPNDYNVAILQKSQYEWLLFLARHFCDGMED